MGPKKFWVQKNFGTKEIFGPKKIWGPKKILGENNLNSKEILGPNKFWVQNNLCKKFRISKKMFGQKKLLDWKNLWPNKNLGSKKLWLKNNFWVWWVDWWLARCLGVGQLECLDIPYTSTNKVHLPLRPQISLYYTSPGGWVGGWLAGWPVRIWFYNYLSPAKLGFRLSLAILMKSNKESFQEIKSCTKIFFCQNVSKFIPILIGYTQGDSTR